MWCAGLGPDRTRLAALRQSSIPVHRRYSGPAQEMFVRLGELGLRHHVGHAEGSRRRISLERCGGNGVHSLCLALYVKASRSYGIPNSAESREKSRPLDGMCID